MKKLLAALALSLAAAAPAQAGIGATAYIGGTNDAGAMIAPSLDYRAGGILAQVHLIDLIGKLPNKRLDLAFDVTGVALKRKVGNDVEGVVMPGGHARLSSATSFQNPNWQILAETRLGAEMKQGMGFGIYVVPQVGVSNFTGKVGLSYGGTLQVSAWLGNAGGDGGGGGRKGKKNK